MDDNISELVALRRAVRYFVRTFANPRNVLAELGLTPEQIERVFHEGQNH